MARYDYYDESVEVKIPRRLAIKLQYILSKNPKADIEEVKHGEWKKISIVSEEYGYGQVYYQHDDCKKSPTELYSCPYERCPRCGAKMDGGNAE